MSSILEILKGINAYPIPQSTLAGIIRQHGLEPDSVATAEMFSSDAFILAKADVLTWLSTAPNVTQDDITYSFSESQCLQMSYQTQDLRNSVESTAKRKSRYGYKGSCL